MNRKSYREIEPPDIIVCVEWIDSSGQLGENLSRAELCGVHRLVTVGWLIKEDEDQISVGMDYVPGSDKFRDVQHILKRCVLKRTEYKHAIGTA